MRMRLSQLLISFAITLALLVGLEIVTSTILPAIGWHEYRLTFNVLLILYLAIRLGFSCCSLVYHGASVDSLGFLY